MCGICGELRLDGRDSDPAVVARMLPRLSHRGPDDEGQYHTGPVSLGHRRLAIIDLSERSHQPMVDSRLGLTLVFNGTIYNYPELRSQLQSLGYEFVSSGDTEVILKAYHAWGDSCVARFHGMFAFAIWDGNHRNLFLARDRIGIKPLYYSRTEDFLRFASHPQALLAGGNVDTGIDPVALHHQLTLHAVIPAPRTILKGVRKVAPATTVMVNGSGEVREQRYWSLGAHRPNNLPSEREWIEATHDTLRAAVERRRCISDVPVGVLLSGGLDSSLLVALLAESGVEDLLTFSVGFEDAPEEEGSEFHYSDQVVERFATRHHKIHIPNAGVLQRLPEAVAHMAEPMVAQDAVAFFLLAQEVSKQVKVVQSGQGADEVFGGYFWYPRMERETGSDLERFRVHYFDRDHDEYLRTVNPELHGSDYTAELIAARLAEPHGDTFLDRVLRMDVDMLIVDDPVKRVDNMTMAWGLEARVPFLDHELVELAAQMPPELKLRENGKYPLKAIARGILPDAIIDRPKGYFPLPALKYIRGEFFRFMRDILDSSACRQRGIFQRSYIDMLVADPERQLTRLHGSKLWHLALLELWLQLNVDR